MKLTRITSALAALMGSVSGIFAGASTASVMGQFTKVIDNLEAVAAKNIAKAEAAAAKGAAIKDAAECKYHDTREWNAAALNAVLEKTTAKQIKLDKAHFDATNRLDDLADTACEEALEANEAAEEALNAAVEKSFAMDDKWTAHWLEADAAKAAAMQLRGIFGGAA